MKLFRVDSILNNLYKLSIKSLTVKNKEINFGAFEFISTIRGIEGIEELLGLKERKRTIDLIVAENTINGIGIGSSKQLSNMFDYIKCKGKLEEYLLRFEILLRSVYKDDFLIYIKDNNMFRIYLVGNNNFINLTMNCVRNSFNCIRFEGNAIRTSNLSDYIKNCNFKIEEKIKDCIPDFDEIEKLLMDFDHSKLKGFRSFIEKI